MRVLRMGAADYIAKAEELKPRQIAVKTTGSSIGYTLLVQSIGRICDAS